MLGVDDSWRVGVDREGRALVLSREDMEGVVSYNAIPGGVGWGFVGGRLLQL